MNNPIITFCPASFFRDLSTTIVVFLVITFHPLINRIETKTDQLIQANAMIACIEKESLETCLTMFQGVE